MTDNTVPNAMPDPMDESSSSGPEAVTPEFPSSAEGAAESDWETVNFPGQISVDADTASNPSPEPIEPAIESTVLPPSNYGSPVTNTDELIQLIQDLNHCNDVLLNRVSDLEESLERSQVALQAEIERNQAGGGRDVGPMPQQVAQLLSELDIANDGLRRTTIHNEALQAELDVSQQRIAQLERECTLLQQRFSEKSNALQQAESTCRDLKSRLHRQQRYTLQFKAALEKCLNMPAQYSGAGGLSESTPQSGVLATPQPVSIPRSQHIQPWSADSGSHPDEVSLTDLLRSVKSPGQEASSPPAGPNPSTANSSVGGGPSPGAEKPSDSEAEAVLWQDLERVTQPPVASLDDREPDPWHGPETKAPSPDPFSPLEDSLENPVSGELTFTEPSPWGAPLPDRVGDRTVGPAPGPEMPETDWSEPTPTAPPEPLSASNTTAQPGEPHLPSGLPDFLQHPCKDKTASPAPLVYPLGAQKKRKTLAAVELPSFGRSPRRR
jgi:hypothetical protein